MAADLFATKTDAFLFPFRQALGAADGRTPHAERASRIAQGADAVLLTAFPARGDPQPLARRHPLSGQPFDLEPSAVQPEWRTAARETLDSAVASIRRECGDDPRRAFLTLWRQLPERLRQAEVGKPTALGYRWDLLPADPRAPDHTVWDQAAAASAVASALPKPEMLIFTIASVQQFIEASRRTQDFWMGSFLTSYLMWRAMLPIVGEFGPDAVLMPDLRGQPLVDQWLIAQRVPNIDETDIEDRLKVANLPNVFTALLPEGAAERCAKAAEGEIRTALAEIFDKTRKYVESAVQDALDHQDRFRETLQPKDGPSMQDEVEHLADRWSRLWDEQTKRFLVDQVFWVSVRWGPTADDEMRRYADLFDTEREDSASREQGTGPTPYGILKTLQALPGWQDPDAALGATYPLASARAGRALAAAKQLRHFFQIEEPGHKCTQCGLREALHLFGGGQPTGGQARPRAESRAPAYGRVQEFWGVLAQVDPPGKEGKKLVARVRQGDRLCAVCLTRRLAWEACFIGEPGKGPGGALNLRYDESHVLFPSTSGIATARYKERLLNLASVRAGDAEETEAKRAKLRAALKDYVQAINRLPERVPVFSRRIATVWRAAGTDGTSQRFAKIEGDWLYDESFDAAQRDYGVDKVVADGAKVKLNRLLEAASDLGLRKPSHYYAVVFMDGDHMGEWLAGRKGPAWRHTLRVDVVRESEGPDPDSPLRAVLSQGAVKPLSVARHKALAGVLRDFALEVARRVVEEEYCGQLVFAGGDDLRAMVPLEDLPAVLGKLNRLFRGCDEETLGGTGKAKCGFLLSEDHQWAWTMAGASWSDEFGQRQGITTKAGVAVAHQGHPLFHVMEQAVQAEKDAKSRGGRDAFAISVLKRSGERVSVVSKWVADTTEGQAVDLMKQVNLLEQGFLNGVSGRLPALMRQFARSMEGPDGQEMRRRMWDSIAARLEEGLPDEEKRKRPLSGPGGSLLAVLEKRVVDEAEARKRPGGTGSEASIGKAGPPWEELTQVLALARFLAAQTGE